MTISEYSTCNKAQCTIRDSLRPLLFPRDKANFWDSKVPFLGRGGPKDAVGVAGFVGMACSCGSSCFGLPVEVVGCKGAVI